jgi:tRNA(Ile)-lysidine synthase
MDDNPREQPLSHLVGKPPVEGVIDSRLPRKSYILLEKARNSIERYGMLRGGEKVLVAVSGGPDSLVLLDVLWRLRDSCNLYLEVFHVDHALRPDSAAEAEYVGRVAETYRLPFHYERVAVKLDGPRGRMSPEEAAREARYDSLMRRMQAGGFDRVALGHQADDRVETLLLRLITGAGPGALASIPPVRGPYIRPLIEVWSTEIEGYLDCLPLPPLLDPTNLDLTVPRNRVRHTLLPFLESEFNPAVRMSLARTLDLINEERAEGIINGTVPLPTGPGDPVELDAYAEMSLDAQRLLLWRQLLSLGLRPSFRLVEDLRANICAGRSGNRMDLPGGWTAVREYGRVFFLKGENEDEACLPAASQELEVSGEGLYHCPAAGISLRIVFSEVAAGWRERIREGPRVASLDLDRLTFPLLLRFIRPGDRFKPLGAPGSRKVQDFLTDAKVPRRARLRTTVLLSRGHIAWLVGHRIDDGFKVTPDTLRMARCSIEDL